MRASKIPTRKVGTTAEPFTSEVRSAAEASTGEVASPTETSSSETSATVGGISLLNRGGRKKRQLLQ